MHSDRIFLPNGLYLGSDQLPHRCLCQIAKTTSLQRISQCKISSNFELTYRAKWEFSGLIIMHFACIWFYWVRELSHGLVFQRPRVRRENIHVELH